MEGGDGLLERGRVQAAADQRSLALLRALWRPCVVADRDVGVDNLLRSAVQHDAESCAAEVRRQPPPRAHAVVLVEPLRGAGEAHLELREQGAQGHAARADAEVLERHGNLVRRVVDSDVRDVRARGHERRDHVRREAEAGDHEVARPAGLAADVVLGDVGQGLRQGHGLLGAALHHGIDDVLDAQPRAEDEARGRLHQDLQLLHVLEADDLARLAVHDLVGRRADALRGVAEHVLRARRPRLDRHDVGQLGRGVPREALLGDGHGLGHRAHVGVLRGLDDLLVRVALAALPRQRLRRLGGVLRE
mmetsp:Transcript_14413/g.36896  ORF Transcript_14413/g.36896 Transcript_14413/m.36896 type:complete len:305 (+) Transcript_14413:2893-3807(+)